MHIALERNLKILDCSCKLINILQRNFHNVFPRVALFIVVVPEPRQLRKELVAFNDIPRLSIKRYTKINNLLCMNNSCSCNTMCKRVEHMIVFKSFAILDAIKNVDYHKCTWFFRALIKIVNFTSSRIKRDIT